MNKYIIIFIFFICTGVQAILPLVFVAEAIALAFATPTATMLSLGTLGVGATILTQQQQQKLNERLSIQLPSEAEKLSQSQESQNRLGQILQRISGMNKPEAICSDADKHRHAQTCGSTPEECCKSYLEKFKNSIHHEKGGYHFFKDKKKSKVTCCLEFDHTHKGFEIFDKNGNHMGERSCLDLNDDPCSYTESAGKHAKPNSSTHHPRSASCKK